MSPKSKKRHSKPSKTKSQKLISFAEYKKQNTEDKPTSLKHKILINILAVVIVAVIGCAIFITAGQYRVHHAGATDKDTLVATYISALSNHNRADIKQCYYPYQTDMKEFEKDIDRQITYAANQIDNEKVTWDATAITTEWTAIDTSQVTEILKNVKPDEASLGVSFVPLTQTTADDYIIHQEDVYEFITFRVNDKWYLAAYMQDARNITKVIDPNGRELSEDEINKWLYSLSYEIGNDNVGYIYVDKSWVQVEDPEAKDDYILTFITNDHSSYMTMASIKDSDVESIDAYTTSIIEESTQNYGDIIVSDGVIGEYATDVKIAQNEEKGSRIIIWTFKTNPDDERTHVITLEAFSEYDASTYINTFHTTKMETDNTSADSQSKNAE